MYPTDSWSEHPPSPSCTLTHTPAATTHLLCHPANIPVIQASTPPWNLNLCPTSRKALCSDTQITGSLTPRFWLPCYLLNEIFPVDYTKPLPTITKVSQGQERRWSLTWFLRGAKGEDSSQLSEQSSPIWAQSGGGATGSTEGRTYPFGPAHSGHASIGVLSALYCDALLYSVQNCLPQ